MTSHQHCTHVILLNSYNQKSPGRNAIAFSLIEFIGVLAILAIVAAAIASATIRRLDIAVANLESTNLVSFSTALQNSALRNRYIPGPTGASNWVQMIATELGISPYMVTTNNRNFRRVLLVDPNNSLSLPYTQSLTGTASILPPNARAIILSTLGPAFPTTLVDGTTNDFNAIWTTPDGARPTVSSSNPLNSWNGKGGDLVVQRIDFGSLFVHLVLWNYPPPNPPQGRFLIDPLPGQVATNSANLVPQNSVNTYYFRTTLLSLWDSQVNPARQVDQILNRDTAFFYIQSVWRGTLDFGVGLGQGSTNIVESSKVGAAFGATAAAFLSSAYSTDTATTPPMVLTAMSNLMALYIPYASSNFPPGNAATAVRSAQTNLVTQMQALFDGPANAKSPGCSNAPAL